MKVEKVLFVKPLDDENDCFEITTATECKQVGGGIPAIGDFLIIKDDGYFFVTAPENLEARLKDIYDGLNRNSR